MFISGLLAGLSVSLLTVVFLKRQTNKVVVEEKEYKVEIKVGQNYHSAIIKFREME